MSNTTDNIAIAKISQYLSVTDIAKKEAFFGGIAVDKRLPQLMYIVRKTLDWANANLSSDTSLPQVTNYIFSICSGYVSQAQGIFNSGVGGGVIVNPATGIANIQPIFTQFRIGDIGSPMSAGDTVYITNLGTGTIFLSGTLHVSLDQSELPRNTNIYRSYTYTFIAGILTITFNQAVANSELYIIQYEYLIS